MLIQARPVGKHPLVIDTENRFTVIGKLSEWKRFWFNHLKIEGVNMY